MPLGANSLLGRRARRGNHQCPFRNGQRKRVFQDAWESRPCLVLSSGFYEWQKQNGGPKQPYRVCREDTPAFAMAGLWEVWEGDEQAIRV
nr:SOS response-associated peptidase family protein [Haladaptatus halobius]